MDVMNILIISPDAPPRRGGISRLVGLLKEGLERLGHHVTLIHPKFRIKELKFSTIPLHRYADRYDLIHLHGPTPLLSDLTLTISDRSRIIYTHHAEVSWLSEDVSKIYRCFHRFLARGARAIIVHSHDYARLFKEKNVIVIRMPCFFKPQSNLDPDKKHDPFTVLYVGQLRPFKGLDVLLKTAAMLEEVNFIIAGDGYLKQKLFQNVKNLSNVKILGAVNDKALAELYNSSHVVCLPSTNTTEAYGLVLIEGALHGCLPLASNLLGVRENISMLCGRVFQPSSHLSLAKELRLLSNNRELYVSLAEKSQRAALYYAMTYTPEYYVKKHEELFMKCISY